MLSDGGQVCSCHISSPGTPGEPTHPAEPVLVVLEEEVGKELHLWLIPCTDGIDVHCVPGKTWGPLE